MKIVIVHPRYCIRAQKQLEGLLKNRDLEIILVINDKKYGRSVSEFVRRRVKLYSIKFGEGWLRKRRLINLMEKVTPGAQLIHCHNEPDFHVAQILERFKSEIPIIYDIHDLASMRNAVEIPDEAYSYQNADAIIHVSDQLLFHSEKKYGPQNAHVIMSLPSRNNIIVNRKEQKLKGPFTFVYQGGLIDVENEKDTNFSYRHYLDIFRSILEEGHSVHAFPNIVHSRLPAYQQLEKEFPTFKLQKKLPYAELMKALGGYDFGIVGFNMDYALPDSTRKYLHAALGNKLFDYIFAGIPVVTIDADAMTDFTLKHKCGIDKRPDETWSEAIERGTFRSDLDILAEEFCMENQIKKLWDIYTGIT